MNATQARSILLSWEVLRLAYNGSLITFVITWAEATLGPAVLHDPGFWILCAAGGLISNVCFFLGPAVELYVVFLFGRSPGWLRPTLMVAGTLFTAIAAAVWIVSLGKMD